MKEAEITKQQEMLNHLVISVMEKGLSQPAESFKQEQEVSIFKLIDVGSLVNKVVTSGELTRKGHEAGV